MYGLDFGKSLKMYPSQKKTSERDPNGINQHEKGAKLDSGKPMWGLLPLKVVSGAVDVMTFGAIKYSKNGWKSVPDAKERYFAAMMRHWVKMTCDGERIDPDSGLSHWKHFLCNAIFLGYFFMMDDND